MTTEKTPIQPKNDPAFLTQLAIDIESGKVFTDRHCRDVVDVRTAFMPIMFGALQSIEPNTLGMIYERLSEAGPRSVNGMPCFFSMKLLNTEDAEFVISEIQRIRDSLHGIKNELQFNG